MAHEWNVGFWILETGLSEGRRGVGRPDSVICILYSAGRAEGGAEVAHGWVVV